jgi:crossover junction endodeoxyribonuclease RusA
MSADGKALKESYQYQAKSQWKMPIIKENIALSIDLYFGTKRKCDIDNFNKLVLDSLTGIMYEDDSQIYELTLRKFYDKETPRVVVSFLNTL